MQYERTLSTVWDDLLESLDSETRDLLDVLAFLNPDCISEDLLRGKPDTTSGNLTVNNSFRLTVMLSSLIRRNLLERNITTTCPSLRMHRLLQLTLLLNLDRRQEKRQEAFDNAVRLTRDALPRRDMTSRLPQFDAIWKQHMPQVLSLQAAFEQSNLSIAAGFEFASLLADAGSFLWEHRLNRIAIPLLTLGEKIVVAQLQEGETHSVLASIENFLAVLSAYDSVEDRRLAMQRLKRVVQLREGILRSLPDKTATLEQQIDLGRAWNDLAYIHADTEEFEEADQGTAKALELYKSLGDERSLRFRFAIQYQSIAAVRFGQGRLTEALDLSRRSYELCKSELGPRHLETARMEVEWSYVLIGAGDLHGALDRLMDALAVRSERLERDNPAILNTKYWIGTVYHYLDQLEEAEEYLRQAIEFGADSDLGKPDLARSQYRLALLLYEQRRWKEAVTFEEAALSSISDEEQATIFCDGDGRDKRKDITMEVLDRRVFLQNGRSTGPFRGERTGKV